MSGAAPLPRALSVAPADGAVTTVTLDYAARFLRRRVLTTDAGWEMLVDLPQTLSVEDGTAFVLDDGRQVAVAAAAEALLSVTDGDLVRLAWHIGNRHTPAQIERDRILIRADPVMADMLTRLGACLTPLSAPFRPERGAYGHGRTHGHSHHDAAYG